MQAVADAFVQRGTLIALGKLAIDSIDATLFPVIAKEGMP